MVRVINNNWKQPIAYFLVSGSWTGNCLQDITLPIVNHLQNINLNIKKSVTNRELNFSSLANNFHVSSDKLFFEVLGKNIYYIFDTSYEFYP